MEVVCILLSSVLPKNLLMLDFNTLKYQIQNNFFSQLLSLHFALMFALPVMQLFLPSVSCCYNKPFPIHVISKGEKTAWKQNKENRTKENRGFFQRPI